MSHKKNIVKISVLLTALLTSVAAQADSAYEWGYWDNAPQVEAKEFYYVKSNVITAEQERIGTNKGELVTDGDNAPWIGYINYSESSFNNNGSGSFEVNGENKVAVLQLTPIVREQIENLEERMFEGSLNVKSSEPKLNMSFDSSNNGGSEIKYSNFGYGSASGNAFSGDAYSATQTGSNRYQGSGNSIRTRGGFGEFLASAQINSYTETYENVSSEGETFNNYLSSNNIGGNGVIGKVMPLADIAEQARLGATYSFRGAGLNNGQSVRINLDFAGATWNGQWSLAKNNNGFNAAGNITGATLNSTSVTGLGSDSVGYVQSGKVTGTLIGVINSTTLDAGVIGKTELNVKGGDGIVNQTDVFVTHSSIRGGRAKQ